MAELQLRGTEVAAAIGMTQGSFSRRYTGSAAWELDELEILEETTGISIAYLLGWEEAPGGEGIKLARAPKGSASAASPALGPSPTPAERAALPPTPPAPRLVYADSAPILFDRSAWPGAVPAAAGARQ